MAWPKKTAPALEPAYAALMVRISTIDILHIKLIKNRRKLPYGAASNSILR